MQLGSHFRVDHHSDSIKNCGDVFQRNKLLTAWDQVIRNNLRTNTAGKRATGSEILVAKEVQVFGMKAVCLLSLAALLLVQTEARILGQCDAVRELQRAGISRSMISNWVCLMQSESGMDTRLVVGPKTAASYTYGVFQISSAKWCARGRRGGICNKRCEDFADDDIQDDIVCAKKIYDTEGFKAWNGWVKKCKSKPLPNIGQCRRRRSVMPDIIDQ